MTNQTKPANLAGVKQGLSGSTITALNKLAPGAGTELHSLLSQLAQAHDATGGGHGPVGIKKQVKKDQRGNVLPALTLGADTGTPDRIDGVADPVDDFNAVNKRTLKRYVDYSAAQLKQDFQEGNLGAPGKGGAPGGPGSRGPGGTGGGGGGRHGGGGGGTGTSAGCSDVQLSNGVKQTSRFTRLYNMITVNEYVYAMGFTTGAEFEVFRIGGDSNLNLVGSLGLSAGDQCQHMRFANHYIFACGSPVSPATQSLLIIDVIKPDNPQVVTRFNTARNLYNLHVQGHFCYVASDDGVLVVNCASPGSPSIAAIASA